MLSSETNDSSVDIYQQKYNFDFSMGQVTSASNEEAPKVEWQRIPNHIECQQYEMKVRVLPEKKEKLNIYLLEEMQQPSMCDDVKKEKEKQLDVTRKSYVSDLTASTALDSTFKFSLGGTIGRPSPLGASNKSTSGLFDLSFNNINEKRDGSFIF